MTEVRTDYRSSTMDAMFPRMSDAPPRIAARPTVRLCKKLAAEAFEVSEETLIAKSRELWIVHPRWATMWLAYRVTGQSLAQIGRAFDTDHSTVRHAVLSADELRQSEFWFRSKTDDLIDLFRREY